MLQTFWQFNRQNIRKIIDMGAGAITTYGAMHGELGVIGAGVAVMALNYAWFYFDNKYKVTVEGLEASTLPGTNDAAAKVAKALKEATK